MTSYDDVSPTVVQLQPSGSLPIPDLTGCVQRYWMEHATDWGLRPEAVQVQFVLNWSGFTNRSFSVTDGVSRYHLKLAEGATHQRRLRKWQTAGSILTARYHAPAILAWLDVPDTAYAGLLFAHLAGRPADFRSAPGLLPDVLAVMDRFHRDSELPAILQVLEPAGDYADCLVETYIHRFDGDLATIVRNCPPFVSASTLDWMQAETRHLEALVRASGAFANPAQSPVHGDLHPNNFLVTDQHWYLIDWDDLVLGDPALDYAILLWPLCYENPGCSWHDFPISAPDAAFAERIELYLRAQLLDGVIDVLADYIEAAVVPERQAEVQTHMQREHVRALHHYRQRYGDRSTSPRG